ncbi:MAG: S-layer homology domain-containing protein, partial [Oscillospiraceae bacterium]|nr:S-layer homology domain-containing protein [Oscillospiraceae bacterium]
WGGKFEPDKVMTELEFLQYIMMVDSYHYQITRAETQEYYARKGVEVEASPDKLLTRQEAARIISEYLGYGKLAEQSKWFLFPFSDFVADAYKGYVTICYMLGIVNGNAAGEFDAAGKVTRAHAAVMLHNLIISKS